MMANDLGINGFAIHVISKDTEQFLLTEVKNITGYYEKCIPFTGSGFGGKWPASAKSSPSLNIYVYVLNRFISENSNPC